MEGSLDNYSTVENSGAITVSGTGYIYHQKGTGSPALSGSGTLNGIITEFYSNAKVTFAAHGDAVLGNNLTLGQRGSSDEDGWKLQIPQGAALTISEGKTLDATRNGITVDNLTDYYTNDGVLVVNGTAKFPAGTTTEMIGQTAGIGTILIDQQSYYPVSVAGGTADKTIAAAGETVTLTPGAPGPHQRFKCWTATPGVTITENTFTMPARAVTVRAEYESVYTVSFDSRGGGGIDSQAVVENGTATEPAPPLREGWQFGGWYSNAACTVPYDFKTLITGDLTLYAKWLEILPDPPAKDNDTLYQLVKEDGISEVPAGLKTVEGLETPQKLVTQMKTKLTEASAGIKESDTAVYDVELMVSQDDGKTWSKAAADNFPQNGLSVTLPYPAGTDKTYTFTVVHMFTTRDFDKTPGDTEKPDVTNTDSGIRFTVTGLSPISVGWTAPKPVTPADARYKITFDANGGTVSPTSARTETSGKLTNLPTPTRSGYAFDGWYTAKESGERITTSSVFRADAILYAHWTRQSGGGNGGGASRPSSSSRPAGGEEPVIAPAPEKFSDVPSGAWYREAVDFVVKNSLMTGYGNGNFGPDENLSRAQLAQILFNREGRPAVSGTGAFRDVAGNAWYAGAVAWANANGIAGGYGNGQFGPNDPITREQLAVMLWRYAGNPAATDKELHFTDAGDSSAYARDALRWAVEKGILNGTGDGRLNPRGWATRAQAAAMLMRYLNDTRA